MIRLLGSLLLKLIFLSAFGAVAYYIFYLETEKYESESIVMIKDLSQEQTVSPLGALLSNVGSESMRDAKLLEVYLKSNAMYEVLDKRFNLHEYYSSEKIDLLHRLSNDFKLPDFLITQQNLLVKYNDDLSIQYDEASGTIKIAFIHADAKNAQKILNEIIYQASQSLNYFEKETTQVVLDFLIAQERKKYYKFMDSLKKLLAYQTKHHTINPKIDIESKSTILAGLESELVQKEVEYNSKLQYLNPSSPEMRLLKGNIRFVQKSIKKVKNQITGHAGKQKLHVDMSDFELLKNEMEFNKELYRQTLAKLEETKVSIQQNKKNLIIISKAEVPDSYSYPNKIKDVITMFILFLFLYSITALIFTLIHDHKD